MEWCYNIVFLLFQVSKSSLTPTELVIQGEFVLCQTRMMVMTRTAVILVGMIYIMCFLNKIYVFFKQFTVSSVSNLHLFLLLLNILLSTSSIQGFCTLHKHFGKIVE